MASQKEKFLSSAQKFIQKGQLDRAIRDYEQVVAMDPKDARQRQKLAELLARCNRNDEAIREYHTIAQYYEAQGFYLKAIAVYKQIQKLDPQNINVCLTLASLNEKNGLIGNALSEYKNIFDYYDRSGLSEEARNILEKMHSTDPQNLEIHLKLAEMRFAAGLRDDAYNDYTTVARSLKSVGNNGHFDKVCARIETLFPEKKEFLFDLLEDQMKNGAASDAVATLKQMLKTDEENKKVLYLLAEALRQTGDREGEKEVLNRLLHLHPSEAVARERLLDCVVTEGNLEESLRMLDAHASDLISAGMSVPLEKFYTLLQSEAPYDIRILQGLEAVYEASGEESKLAEVKMSLKILCSDVAKEETGFSGNEDIFETISVAEANHDEGETDFPWEEEIELTIPADAWDMNEPGSTPGHADRSRHTVSQEFPWKGVTVPDMEAIQESQLNKQASEILPFEFAEALPEIEIEEESFQYSDPVGVEVESLQVVEEEQSAFPPANETPAADEEHRARSSELGNSLDQHIEREDTESHFNLGIAYKEMGLYDNAIKEFTAAAIDPFRTADCMILQGICFREQGDLQNGEQILLTGMASFDRDQEKTLSLKYELGLLYEVAGRNDEALRLFREVFSSNPGFRDTVSKIATLHAGGDRLDFSDIDNIDIELGEIR